LARALSPFDGATAVVTLESAKEPDLADPAEVADIRREFLGG
jgi:hypothetical protein